MKKVFLLSGAVLLGIFCVILFVSLCAAAYVSCAYDDSPAYYREEVPLNNPQLEEYLKEKTKHGRLAIALDDVGIVCCKNLRFSLKENKLTSLSMLRVPTEGMEEIPTNCVGYTRAFVSMCNYVFKANNIDAHAYHAVGPVKVGKYDFTKMASNFFTAIGSKRYANFFKDHDYARIRVSKEYQEIYDSDDYITMDLTFGDLYN